jgi:hypothetical protein
MTTEDRRRNYKRGFWAAVAITVAAWLLPLGGLVIYPFTLLATWAHEMGHGIMALLVGGEFMKLEIYPTLGGAASTFPGEGTLGPALVAAGGLLAPSILGAAVVAVSPRRGWAQGILGVLAGLLALSVIFFVRNLFGIIAIAALAALLVLAGWRLNPWWRFIVVQLIGIQLSLSPLRGWRYLFVDRVTVGGQVLPSDTAAIGNALFGPYWLWGILILAFDLAILYGAYKLVVRHMRGVGKRVG